MDNKIFDFCGWASRNNIKCSDGRVIRKDAFKDQDGKKVPLVWNHDHKSAENVLGHAILENKVDGVYAYCSFNEQEQGINAKGLVRHGDITSLSIYANKLKQTGSDVTHGCIREVSLVLAGANPGAYIENIITHGEDDDYSAEIFNPSEELIMSEDYKESDNLKKDENKTQEGETIMDKKDESLVHAKDQDKKNEKTIKDVIDGMSEEQQNVLYAMIGLALDEKEKENNDAEGDKNMKHNAFENDNKDNKENILTHSEILGYIDEAKKLGSLKDVFLAHSITDISELFPEAQAVASSPEIIADDDLWVSNIMKNVSKSPFSKVKSMAVNITGDEARAKGYIKGSQKGEEIITALKRVTTPVTVYKMQKIDRDDVIDIVDFDTVAFIKKEMKVKLDEEIARAIIIGDQRAVDSSDKINPINIRPILGDNSIYTIPRILTKGVMNNAEFAKAFIKDVIVSRKSYKGSGNPTLYTTEDMLTEMLLIEDSTGRAIYDTIEKLMTKLRVKDIVTIPQMSDCIRHDTAGTKAYTCLGVLVNLKDYNVGADKGGQISFFDDFDLNFNKFEYLIETRCSGALIKPYAAVSFEEETAVAPAPEPPAAG